jgi:hypothetical protein
MLIIKIVLSTLNFSITGVKENMEDLIDEYFEGH